MIIYNLYAYLVSSFSSYYFCIGGFKPKSPITAINLSIFGSHTISQDRLIIQVLVRSEDYFSANKISYEIYELLQNRYGLILPSYTEDTTVFPSIKADEINPNNIPQSIGTDENGNNLFSTSYYIATS